jgi:putative hydrolase of the HAD superfamily
VLFDLYETLVTEQGLDVPRAGELGPRFGIAAERYRPLWKAQRRRIVRGELTFRDALLEIGLQLKVDMDPALVDRVSDERRRAKTAVMQRVDPELAALTRTLREHGMRLALVSNCMAEDVAAWQECALAPEFSAVLFSHEIRMAKPDREIYLEAVRRLDADQAETVFVGDPAVEDLVGAEGAGLRTVCATWFLAPDAGHPALARVPLVSTPHELLELLRP